MRIGFHLGPFYFSQRLGRTQAQKRAAAKARAKRVAERERKRAIREAQSPEAIAAEQARVWEAAAAEQARRDEFRRKQIDHDSRTHRGVITECRIDPLNGGSFTIRTEDMQMAFNLAPNAATHFLSLKKGDVVQVTLAPGKTGLEEFWQLSRANGTNPRSPVELTAADMEWFGLAGAVSQITAGGQNTHSASGAEWTFGAYTTTYPWPDGPPNGTGPEVFSPALSVAASSSLRTRGS